MKKVRWILGRYLGKQERYPQKYGRYSGKHATAAAVYTVEASYVMSLVILSLAILISAAYDQYRDKTSLFLMNDALERLYGQEEKRKDPLQYGSFTGNAERTGRQVSGTIRYRDRVRTIQKRVHEPEEALWMMTIWGQSKEAGADGGQLPQGNEKELSDD